MAVRRPLISNGGQVQQLSDGDVIAGVPMYIPAFIQSGAMLKLALATTMTLPIFNRAGTALQVQVIPNG